MTFPESEHLVIGKGKQTAILTLWTKKEHVLSCVPEQLYAVASQLYSRDEGLSMLVRGLFLHKNIRDIVVVGVDLNHCADALFALWKNGVVSGQVVGAAGFVDPEIPQEAIDRLREHVELHDLRTEREYENVRAYIEKLEEKASWGEAEEFPAAVIQRPKTFPTQKQHWIREEDMNRAAIRLAHMHDAFGELHNVQLHLTSFGRHPDPLVNQDAYTDSFLHSTTSTHSDSLAEKLTSMASVLTRDKSASVLLSPQEPSLLTAMQIYHAADGLHLACFVDHIRFDGLADLCSALFSALELVAAEVHLAANTITVTASILSAKNSTLLPVLLAKRLPVLKLGDPRSNLLIRLRNGVIEVTHLSPEGKRLELLSGTNAQLLYLRIINEHRISDLSHAAYLGYELARAEVALKSGGMYEQDTV